MRARRARAGSRLIARVQPLVTARTIDRAFDYSVPEGLALAPGCRVRVPLGARSVEGVVLELAEEAEEPGAELRPVDEVLGAVPAPLLELAAWIAEEYGSTLPRALALVIPPRPPRRALAAVAAPAEAPARSGPLTDAQRAAVDGCMAAVDGDEREVLLHGVTGSGKTEVYLEVIERVLERGGGAIVLVPEIALTPQTAARFVGRFGDTVAVLHSALTPARRGAAHARIAAGEARVVVGARSAIFAAVPRLGVIVVDEEHDGSYKHESDPRYDARRVAAKRARIEGATVLLGSATPRAESWHGVRRRIAMPGRIGGELPLVEVVDLRRDGGYPFTRPLLDALAGIEDGGGRAVLLLNRRGAASALHCRTCARSWRCPRCDVALVLHGRTLACHHCGLREPAPRACPACGSVDLARIGAGTERVERELAERFARLEVLRLDADVAARGGRAGGDARPVPRRRSGGAGGHADRGQGPRRAGRDAGGGAGRRDRAGGARLPGRGADVRPAHPAGRAAGAAGRPARPRADPGLGAGRPRGRAGGAARRRGVPGPASWSGAGSSATRRSCGWCGCWSPRRRRTSRRASRRRWRRRPCRCWPATACSARCRSAGCATAAAATCW